MIQTCINCKKEIYIEDSQWNTYVKQWQRMWKQQYDPARVAFLCSPACVTDYALKASNTNEGESTCDGKSLH